MNNFDFGLLILKYELADSAIWYSQKTREHASQKYEKCINKNPLWCSNSTAYQTK